MRGKSASNRCRLVSGTYANAGIVGKARLQLIAAEEAEDRFLPSKGGISFVLPDADRTSAGLRITDVMSMSWWCDRRSAMAAGRQSEVVLLNDTLLLTRREDALINFGTGFDSLRQSCCRIQPLALLGR